MLDGRQGGVLVIDDTVIEKSGHEMEGTGYLFDHAQHRNVWCHCFVTSLYSNGDERVPMHSEPYIKEEACASSGRRFRTKNELAVELVDKALGDVRPKAIVFDSWYGSQELMRHIDSRPGVHDRGEGQPAHRWQGCRPGTTWPIIVDEFKKVVTGTEFRYAHEVVIEDQGRHRSSSSSFSSNAVRTRALVLMTNALDMSVSEVICFHISGVGILRCTTETASNAWEWASTRSGQST